MTHYSARFSRFPPEVLYDQRLTVEHLRVYGALASSVPRGKKTTNLGQRLISRLVRLSQRTVNRRLADLEEFGHIKAITAVRGLRVHYEMCSAAFESSKGKWVHVSSHKQALSSTVRKARAFAKTAAAGGAVVDEIFGKETA